MIVLWIAACCAGLALTMFASSRAIQHLTAILRGTRIPPFVLGITLVAIGTDLPEIANSIVSSATGHGDINVGDSIGSAATQVTLVLGLLPFICGGFAVQRRQIGVIGIVTCACLGLGLLLVRDGDLDRIDALGLLAAWLFGSFIAWRSHLPMDLPNSGGPPVPDRSRHVVLALLFLAVVGAGSWLAIHALIQIARSLAAPEYLISFLGLALGTSLPELAVDLTAIRRGHTELAVGDVFGSSLVDASLSISVGPLLFPNVVDADLAVRGGYVALASVAIATGLLAYGARHSRWRGAVLLLVYAGFYPVLFVH